jgi:Domain of unknown function (DUF4129)
VNSGGPHAFGALRPPIDPHALARKILAEPRFRIAVVRPKPKTWWDVLTQWLSDRWHQLLDAFSRHVHVGPKASIAFGDLLIALAILAVVVAGVRLALGIARENSSSRTGARFMPQHASAESLYAQSLREAERGDYAAAAIALFNAAVATLDLQGTVHDDPSRTVNEMRAAVRSSAPECVSPFDTIARTFTAAFYAGVPVSNEQWNAARTAFAQLTAQARPDAA